MKRKCYFTESSIGCLLGLSLGDARRPKYPKHWRWHAAWCPAACCNFGMQTLPRMLRVLKSNRRKTWFNYPRYLAYPGLDYQIKHFEGEYDFRSAIIFTFLNLHKTWFPNYDHDASKHASLYCLLSSILTPDSTNGTRFAFGPSHFHIQCYSPESKHTLGSSTFARAKI
jgi:hypothetical protein